MGVHNHNHSVKKEQKKVVFLALAVTFFFMFFEIAVGYFSGSLALLSDALHMFTDSAALFVSLAVLLVSERIKNIQFIENLGAALNSSLVLFLSVFLFFEALERFYEPTSVEGMWVVITGILGFFVNFFVMKILHSQSKSSEHLKAAYLHVLGDLFGSLAAIVAGGIIEFGGPLWIDPLMTFLISFLVFVAGLRILKVSVLGLLKAI
ncbi:MAG: hypothetical protein CL678_18425 [Bdellovibrionaceae bacterium]|nr:hypothetical protein [Pseudobdellovibrionaceae bacterium]|tara:strand:+ start:1131 stop:1751 length:621 start_codon:yes stop_codon:yes gene_type:complete